MEDRNLERTNRMIQLNIEFYKLDKVMINYIHNELKKSIENDMFKKEENNGSN